MSNSAQNKNIIALNNKVAINSGDTSPDYLENKLSGIVDDNTLKVDANNNLKLADRVELNTMLNAFRIAINGSLTQQNMVDGVIDEFEDETGVDTVNSTGEYYDSTNDLYTNLDSNTKLLLNFNGNDGATTTDDASISNHTINFFGTAQLDTAQKKFGTASLLLDGNSDYLTIADSSDWNIFDSNSDNWTIDFFVKHTDHAGTEEYLEQRQDANNRWLFYHTDGSGLRLLVFDGGGTAIDSGFGGEITDTNWHHVALVKVADEYGIYLDGTQVKYVQDTSTATINGTLYIGQNGAGANYFDGWLDDIRIKHSNHFSASPNVGLTDTIVVPTSEATVGATTLSLISNSSTAEAEADNARIVIFEEDVDAVTENTDLLAYVSRDGGTTFSQITLADEGDYETGKRILTGTLDISGQPSGTSMEWKITSANDKEFKLHGVGLLWD